ncbi:PAS domain-containing sensor histidine kinase [Arenivirga flava]|uniref:PAS domain-containing sensor histidine kinase n=1 Tax=Arenivirga flava TaxID=1930060 RepID=UPI0024E120CC|nr:PAS domain-containing sensor histidine kinase [Arenivirga flava]
MTRDTPAPGAPDGASVSDPSSQSWTAQVTSLAIVRLDRDGIVCEFNAGAERIKGYRAEEIIGSSFERFYRPEDRAKNLPYRLLAIAEAEGFVEDTGWRVRADGSVFWANLVITALRDDSGGTTGFMKITRDLTPTKRHDEARQVFLETFVHDFLSPITALQGRVDLLAETTADPYGHIERLQQVSDHLVAMARQLRTFATREEPSDLATRLEPLDVREQIDAAVMMVLPTDPYARITITGDAVLVTAEATGLRRSLANLIENALKYSDETVAIAARRYGDDVSITITDTGRGIEADDLNTIFDAHERGALADSDDGGSGLGLASVKRLLDRQNATVRLRSTVGVGTTATVTLRATTLQTAPAD